MPRRPLHIRCGGLDASRHARRRLAWLVEVVAGTCTAAEACRALGVGRTQLYELRARVLQAALAALEPRRRGRPPRQPLDPEAAAAEIARLRDRVAALERELALARAQAMVAGLLTGNPGG